MRLASLGGPELQDLLYWSNCVRRQFIGDQVSLCSIISARSGGCGEDCKFCAQSARYRTGAPRHGLLSPEEISKAAAAARQWRATRFGIVTSGNCLGAAKDFEAVSETVAMLRSQYPDLAVCASLGKLSPEMAARLKAAGLSRFNHNLETSERFFPRICSTHTYADRLQTARVVKRAGLELCCGGIFGMGESWEDRVDLALALRELDADSVPINFLNPIPGTPLSERPLLPPMEALHIVALYRLLLPTKEIKVCGGREVVLRELQSWMFYAGASATMAGNYLTTAGRPAEEDLRMIADLGLGLKGAAP